MNVLEARRRLLGADIYKKTAEGNPISVRSLARMYPGIEMEGWTEQASTTGAQLFKPSQAKYEVSGVTFEFNNGSVTVHGKSENFISTSGRFDMVIPIHEATYFISSDEIKFEAWVIDSSGTDRFYQNKAFTLDGTEQSCRVYLLLDQGQTFNGIAKAMLNSGSEALPWEPYTGGQPSPSPNYPQEIVNAGKFNDETQKWEYEVKVQGKNLFDFSKVISSNANMIVDYEKQTITIPAHINNAGYKNTFRDVVPDAIVGMTCVINAKTSNSEAYRYIYLLNAKKVIYFGISFEITDELLNDYFSWYNSLSTNNENIISEIQIEYGDTPTDYEPYKEPQTVLLQSDRPLTKWDRLEKRDGQWGWVYKSGVKQLISDMPIHKNLEGSYQVANFAEVDRNKLAESLSTHFIYKLSTTEYGNFWFDSVGTGLRFRMSQFQTVEEVKSWLQENKLYFAFPTAEETFVPLTEEEQTALNALHTNYPTTVLMNDQGCNMKLTYKTKKSLEVT